MVGLVNCWVCCGFVGDFDNLNKVVNKVQDNFVGDSQKKVEKGYENFFYFRLCGWLGLFLNFVK